MNLPTKQWPVQTERMEYPTGRAFGLPEERASRLRRTRHGAWRSKVVRTLPARTCCRERADAELRTFVYRPPFNAPSRIHRSGFHEPICDWPLPVDDFVRSNFADGSTAGPREQRLTGSTIHGTGLPEDGHSPPAPDAALLTATARAAAVRRLFSCKAPRGKAGDSRARHGGLACAHPRTARRCAGAFEPLLTPA
jgi:hypothetical protein